MPFTADPSTRDLSSTQLKLLDELIFAPQYHQGKLYYHVEVPSKGRYFRIGYPEYVFASLLDGHTSIAQAVTIGARALRAQALSHAHALQVAWWLLSNGLAIIADDGNQRLPSKAGPQRSNLLARLNPFSMKVPCLHPDKLLTHLTRWTGWIFSPAATIIAMLVIAAGVMTIFGRWDRFTASSHSIFSPHNWLSLIVAWTVLKVFHELGHGIAAKRYGADVRELGLMFVLFTPMAYIDVTSVWRLPSKWQRIHVAAAGIYVELVIASIAAFIWSSVDDPLWSNLLYNLIISASVTTLLFNINPLMRFDGYYILSDWMEVPNLASDALVMLQNVCKRLLFGDRGVVGKETGLRAWIVAFYALGSAVWKLLISCSLLLAASVLGKGLGLVLVPLGIGLWFAKPLWTIVKDAHRRFHENRLSLIRATCISSAVSIVLVGLALWCPWPGTVSIPAIVDYVEAARIRSRVDGFIHRIAVVDGQQVQAGEVLLELHNDELQYELESLKTSLAAKEALERGAIDEHNPAGAQVAASELQAEKDRLAEVERQCAALTVRAPIAGRVVARDLDAREGTYVSAGEPLLAVGNEHEKELIVSVCQNELPAVTSRVEAPVWFRVGAEPAQSGVLKRIDPRARRDLPHPAFAATTGGPLAVRVQEDQNGQSRLELLEPAFQGVVRLDATASRAVSSGQQAHVVIGARSEAIGIYLYTLASNWLVKKLEMLQAVP